MACSRYLLYNVSDGTWYANTCGGTPTSGSINANEAVKTDCIEDGSLATPRGTIILDIQPCVAGTPTPTPIVCGQGLTENLYYYTDCCGNFVKGNTPNQIVSLNYSLPYNGIKILNIPTSEICPTPTQTPTTSTTPTPTPNATVTLTPSITLSPTPTLTPTPSQTAAVSYYNECEPITIFPMGIQCNVIQNPTTATSFDGILYITVTGGTPPYSFYWNTGERTQTISNAPAGNYTVLVVDYYGDFSATTTCSLIGPTATMTPTPTITMTPTPTLVLSDLCLTFFGYLNTGAIQRLPLTFVPSGTQNGRPKWFNSSQNLTIFWSTTNNRWEISNWTFGGLPISNTNSLIPSTGWTVIGTPGSYSTVTSTTGSCPPVSPLTFTVQVTRSNCNVGSCTGSIFINTQGGVPPYSYSIDGTNFQTSNIFTNLCPTTFGVVVKDSVGTTATQSVTVTYVSNSITYNVSLVVDGIFDLNNNTKKFEWHLNIVPPLPSGPSIEFLVNTNSIQEKQGPFSSNPNTTMTITSSSTLTKNNSPITYNPATSSVQNLPNVCSPSTLTMQRTTVSQSVPVTIGSGDYLSGSTVSFIDVFNPTSQFNCISTGLQIISTLLSNVTIKGSVCDLVQYNQEPVGFSHTVVGVLTSLKCLTYTCTPNTPIGLTIEWEDCNGNYNTQYFQNQVTICAREGTLNITNGSGIILNVGDCS